MSSKSKTEPKLPSKITILLDDEPSIKSNPIKRKLEESSKEKDKDMTATKMKFSLGSKPKPAPVKISLNKPKKDQTDQVKTVPVKSNTVAAAFNDEDESDEEMPLEAKMKMKNVGKNTPVPSGPNSFGKSKLGFSQDYKMYERKLMEQIGDPDKPHEKKSSNPPS